MFILVCHHIITIITHGDHLVFFPFEETMQEYQHCTDTKLFGQHNIRLKLIQVLPITALDRTPPKLDLLLQVDGSELKSRINLVIIESLVAQIPITQANTGLKRESQIIEEINAIRRYRRMKN